MHDTRNTDLFNAILENKAYEMAFRKEYEML